MDRCALFVDAGYILADGAMAVHGTSHRESVSWDYAGLLQSLAGLAAERTSLPLLRCYWYEATVEGRRTPEHDTLADLAGLKLRLGRMRPGKREGVETEIHRDLTTLARNRAISDALLVSDEEDLAPVIADVQDLGVRVIIVHISVDGNWTVSRSLRQQCDDIVEIDGTQLRPFVDLIVGAEPSRYGEQYPASAYAGRQPSNGHAASLGATGGHQALLAGPAGSYPAPPAIYTAPVVADYQSPHEQAPHQPDGGSQPDYRPSAPQPELAGDISPAEANGSPPRGTHAARGHAAQAQHPSMPQIPVPQVPQAPAAQHSLPPAPVPQAPGSQGQGPQPPGQAQAGPAPGSQSPGPQAPQPGPPAPAHLPAPGSPASHLYQSPTPAEFRGEPGSPADRRAPAEPVHPVGFAEGQPGQFSPASPESPPAAPAPFTIPAGRHGGPGAGSQSPGPQGNGAHAPRAALPTRLPQAPRTQPAQRPGENRSPGPTGNGGLVPQHAGYSPALPGLPAGVPAAVSIGDAVQAAHAEGFEFGESVAREAPALWLEAVLARKPRMPSDLEARLLQGSALPLDSLLHDEVRHALRRGFWDALEHSRR